MASKASSSASQTETLSSTSDQRVSLTLAFLKALGMDKHVPQIFDTSGIYCNLFGSFLKVNDIKRGRISCTIAIKLPFAASTNVNVHQDLKDVKLWQVHTLLKGLEKIVVSADIPMLVCGDFNSVPRSAPHALLAMGKVDPSHPDLTVDPLNILCPHSKLVHQLPLVRAYSSFARTVGLGFEQHK